uniref:Endonuclease/exonuclease/phosphatase domain-containing protein n=1 Tax=Hyaloperonospora arabidopsidis (strain Emoy2) TaxID=559515 RepID=M4C4A4_HYAAE
MDPWNQHLWSRHWMAVRTTHMDSTILVINVYVPTDKSERGGIFDFLRRTLVSYEGPVVLGGVFNCTLNPHLDRSYKTTTGRHDSPALRRLLARVQMSDVLEDELRRIEDE